MLMNLSDVLSEQHKTVEGTVPLELESVKLKSGSYQILKKEPVHLVISHVKEKVYRVEGSARLWIQMPCDRCLQDVVYELPLEIYKQVDLGRTDADLPEGIDESDFIDGYHLDVDKLLMNEILIGWPTKVLCKEDCKGICNVCGQNLNEGSCDCEDTGLDPRLSVVRDLLKNFKEV
jgi:uncharacterized protein